MSSLPVWILSRKEDVQIGQRIRSFLNFARQLLKPLSTKERTLLIMGFEGMILFCDTCVDDYWPALQQLVLIQHRKARMSRGRCNPQSCKLICFRTFNCRLNSDKQHNEHGNVITNSKHSRLERNAEKDVTQGCFSKMHGMDVTQVFQFLLPQIIHL